jgi:SAM-dependent methyltransferase
MPIELIDKHWENIYRTRSPKEVSWYAPHLVRSLELIQRSGVSKDAAIIDVGAGASTLVDDLLERAFTNLTALDVSPEALRVSKDRLGKRAEEIRWKEADLLKHDFQPASYDLWHDRAVFHFLTDFADRDRYVAALGKSLRSGGYAVIATFGVNGPPKCSGLPVTRYSAENLASVLGSGYRLLGSSVEIHPTPSRTTQEFLYCLFQKRVKNRKAKGTLI